MATYLNIGDLRTFLKECEGANSRAFLKAMIASTQIVERDAKINARKQFTGRNDRKVQGGLLNSIYTGYISDSGKFEGFVGTKGIPYGASQEFGATIVPVKANHLWLPVYKNVGKMTPREFIRLTQTAPETYHLFNGMAGKWTGQYTYEGRKKKKVYDPLFILRDEVKLKERPYLRPAIETGLEKFPSYYDNFLAKETTE